LVDDFQLKYGEELTLLNYAAPTVDRDQILIQVLEDIGDETNTEAIRDALYNISNYEGLSGTFSFDEDGEVDLVATLLIFDGESFVPEQ
jgi:branched-chain amino acid transport system substrate-binding protein